MAFLIALLQPNFGREGAAITLLAGTLIAIAFALELSLARDVRLAGTHLREAARFLEQNDLLCSFHNSVNLLRQHRPLATAPHNVGPHLQIVPDFSAWHNLPG